VSTTLATTREEIVQEHPQDAPPGWAEVQQKLAAKTGLSLLLVDGRQPPALVASNNNSICHAFQSSMEYVRLCDPYCGDAHRRALSAGSAVEYKCHAGLQCFTMPVQIGREQNLAAIGGRAFVSAADYRQLIERFRNGELNDLLPSAPFENVIFAETQRLDQLRQRLQKAARSYSLQAEAPGEPHSSEAVAESVRLRAEVVNDETALADADRSSTVSTSAVAPVSERGYSDLQGEINRLTLEVEHRDRLAAMLQRFAQRINSRDPDRTYKTILADLTELLKAERASLMVFDEASNELTLKAAQGIPVAESEVAGVRLGEGIAGGALESGKPLVIENMELAGLGPSPASRNYKTKSFISFPIVLNERRLGVLNIADKADKGTFNAIDLGMLELLSAPIADALDRAQLQRLSITDPLTGLLNRRYLEERLVEELNRSQRYNHAMSFLMIDIDDFKFYNDRNGHLAGDEALRLTARCLKDALRAADVACRFGGEEFCVLLPQTSLAEAGVIAERMRQRVTQMENPLGKLQPLGTVSVSIGISTYAVNVDTAEKIIEAADRALYKAKVNGKNRIEFSFG
jgi:diguanylate cyclase (GGDEF)-like protein